MPAIPSELTQRVESLLTQLVYPVTGRSAPVTTRENFFSKKSNSDI